MASSSRSGGLHTTDAVASRTREPGEGCSKQPWGLHMSSMLHRLETFGNEETTGPDPDSDCTGTVGLMFSEDRTTGSLVITQVKAESSVAACGLEVRLSDVSP